MVTKIARVDLPPDNVVCAKGKYVVNDLVPIGINDTQFDNTFLILFFAHQDFNDEYKYIQLLINTDTPEVFKNHDMNIKNIAKSQQRLESYKILTSNLNKDNIYGTDLDLTIDLNNPLYYYCYGSRAITRSRAELLELYFPRHTFISIRLFLLNLLDTGEFNLNFFLNPLFNEIQYITIEQSKYDCSYRDKNKPVEGLNEIHSHYTMNCGPSEYKMTYITLEKEERTLSNPTLKEDYENTYGNDPYIQYVFYDQNEDCAFVIYFRLEDDKKVKSYALKLPNKIYSNTNFVDSYNKIYI